MIYSSFKLSINKLTTISRNKTPLKKKKNQRKAAHVIVSKMLNKALNLMMIYKLNKLPSKRIL